MGYYRQCLQCGYTFYEQRRRPLRAVASGPVPPGDEDVGPGGPKHTLSEAA